MNRIQTHHPRDFMWPKGWVSKPDELTEEPILKNGVDLIVTPPQQSIRFKALIHGADLHEKTGQLIDVSQFLQGVAAPPD